MSKTPNIFVRSLRELKSTRCLAVTALLIAINVTLDLLGLSIKLPPNLRIGFGFLCNASCSATVRAICPWARISRAIR